MGLIDTESGILALHKRRQRRQPKRPTKAQVNEAIQKRKAARKPAPTAPVAPKRSVVQQAAPEGSLPFVGEALGRAERGEVPVHELPAPVQARLQQNPEALQTALRAHRDRLRATREDAIVAGSGVALQRGKQGGLIPTRRATELAQSNLAEAGQREPLSAEDQKALGERREVATGLREDRRAAADVRRGQILGRGIDPLTGEQRPASIQELLTTRAVERREANIEAGGSIGQLRRQRHKASLQQGLISAQIEQSKAMQARALGRSRGVGRDPRMEAISEALSAAIESGDTERADALQQRLLSLTGPGGIDPALLTQLLGKAQSQVTRVTFQDFSQKPTVVTDDEWSFIQEDFENVLSIFLPDTGVGNIASELGGDAARVRKAQRDFKEIQRVLFKLDPDDRRRLARRMRRTFESAAQRRGIWAAGIFRGIFGDAIAGPDVGFFQTFILGKLEEMSVAEPPRSAQSSKAQ